MMFANGETVSDPDILVYALCSRFNCLPSELEAEDPLAVARLAHIDFIVQAVLKGRK